MTKTPSFQLIFKKDSNKQIKKDVEEEARKSWKGFFCLLIFDG
jgi:hypothetical protein